MSGWWGSYSYRCQPVDYSTNPIAMRVSWFLTAIKAFTSNFVFIFRWQTLVGGITSLNSRNFSTPSFSSWGKSIVRYLHSMLSIMELCLSLFGWDWNLHQVKFESNQTKLIFQLLCYIFFSGGHSTFFALLNTFVHIVMYFYYMVSAMGPEYQKYIWWKKYLTTFQIVSLLSYSILDFVNFSIPSLSDILISVTFQVQFIAIFAHQFQLLFTECNYPKSFMVFIALHGVLFMFLFSDFYKAKYTQSKGKTSNANGGFCMVSWETSRFNYAKISNLLPINKKVTLS